MSFIKDFIAPPARPVPGAQPVATKHQPFVGLLRPLIIYLATSIPMVLFGPQITAFLESLVSQAEALVPFVSTIYNIVMVVWIGGYFYIVLFAYIVDAIFYIRKMPHDLVLKTDNELILAKPLEVTVKGTKKRLLKNENPSGIAWIGSRQVDPDDIWDDDDLIDQTAISFEDIKAVWLVTMDKDAESARVSGKHVRGSLVILTKEDRFLAQPIIEDLRTLVPAFDGWRPALQS